ncbi:MAG: hybrid sensor histidine kinase/response regulator, partial [Verrucomicrobiaceae bacterium]
MPEHKTRSDYRVFAYGELGLASAVWNGVVMKSSRLLSWLPIASVGILAAGILGWLLLVYSGGRKGMVHLPHRGHSTVDSLLDPGGRLTLEDVENLTPQEWTTWSGLGFLTAKRRGTVWVRVTLRNPEDRPLRGVLDIDDYFADRVDAWIGLGAERTHLLSGEAVSKAEKAVAGRAIAFPVNVPAHGTQMILLRIEDFFNGYAHPVWWPSADAFYQTQMRGGLAEGIYLGGLFALLLYNALLALRLRQRDMAFYVLYLGSAAMFIILTRALLPVLGWVLGSPGLETALTVTMALNAIFLTQFASAFLELETHFPRINRWGRGWCWSLLLLAAGSLTTSWWPEIWSPRWLRLAAMCIGATHVGLLTLSLAAWRAGAPQARYFVLSFGCLFAGTLPMVAVWFFQAELRDVAMRGLMVGSALEMLLLSLAVADRFAKAQRKLVEETEHRRMLEEAYADELGEEVRERTRELLAANVDKDRMLAVIGHDLRAPLTGLMRTAEETPGDFPRDVTRTSRALLLMIEDLV